MKDSSDIVIIGGGVIGLTIARSLTLRGVKDITLIEKSALGTEASFAAAGMLAPQVEADANDEFFQLACRSRGLYPSFAAALLEESGVDVELDRTGTLYLALTEDDERDCDHRYKWQQRAGFPVERLSATETRQLEPAVSPIVRSALLFPNDVLVENRKLLRALSASVTNQGIRILEHASVTEIVVKSERVVGVQTSAGYLACSELVLAAGSWTSFLRLAGNNLPLPQIEPVRGQMVCLHASPRLSDHVVYSARGYIAPRRDGRLLAGSTSESAGFAKHVTVSGITSILQNAVEISPSISGLPISDFWAGLRPRAADGLPVLGPCGEIDGLWYATGHYRNGILLAPVTGELIAGAILNARDADLSPAFSPRRFYNTAVGTT